MLLQLVVNTLHKPSLYFTQPQLTSIGCIALFITGLCRCYAIYRGPVDILDPYPLYVSLTHSLTHSLTSLMYIIYMAGISFASAILVITFDFVWYLLAIALLSALLSVRDVIAGVHGYTFDLLVRTVVGVCVLVFTVTVSYYVVHFIYSVTLAPLYAVVCRTLDYLWPRQRRKMTTSSSSSTLVKRQ